MSRKIVTVVGATGLQGKGAVAAFIDNPAYQVRAITRNTSSAAAQALAERGAELVQADLGDLESLKRAFAGSHIVYAVTNFFEPFTALQSPERATEVEVQQGVNLAQAAASALPTLEHYIWSTLPDARTLSAGKYVVPHFDGKARVDAYIRTQQPALLAVTTFFWVTWYHNNYVWPVFTPYWIATANAHVQFANYAPSTPITTLGDVTVNIAPFVRAIVAQPAKTARGNVVLGALATHTADELLQMWARARGTRARFVQVGGEDFRALWPLWGDEMGVMMEFWDEFRDKSWTAPAAAAAEHKYTVLTGDDIGVEGLQGLEEAYKELEL
ncbi:hypothetical protein B0T26DRAFT_642271 [Lasiosphaeria miniovina]|uniref:NmrA-like domain-containing protein n=1 Tax=Lasiosphaeria miniovina TaxID=1954250 RepID=A0AA40AX16_9PEZI|nr:uncharacterized protein B0T26DRAFT_642271 [Lasiosphaeria miniovina]KAK0723548.1 hypothetical protein B0T26DRAFT_642271 [Lasiosphaeria miniovina]